MNDALEFRGIRHEAGWHGAFTRDQAPGAIPNGTSIVKTATEAGDVHPVGTKGTVIGSICDPKVDSRTLYFVEWASRPHAAVAVVDWKIGPA